MKKGLIQNDCPTKIFSSQIARNVVQGAQKHEERFASAAHEPHAMSTTKEEFIVLCMIIIIIIKYSLR